MLHDFTNYSFCEDLGENATVEDSRQSTQSNKLLGTSSRAYWFTWLAYSLTGFLWIFCFEDIGGQPLFVVRNLENLLLWLWNHLSHLVTSLSGQLLLDSHRNAFIASQSEVQELEVKVFLFSCLLYPYRRFLGIVSFRFWIRPTWEFWARARGNILK